MNDVPVDGGQTVVRDHRRVYADTGAVVTALSLRGGKPLWHAKVPGTIRDEWTMNGRLVVDAGTALVSLDRRTGARRWVYRSSSFVDRTVVGDATTLVVVRAHRLVAVDTRTGKPRWQLRSRGLPGEPVAVGGIVVAVRNHQLLGLATGTGMRRWRVVDDRLVKAEPSEDLRLVSSGHTVAVTSWDLDDGYRIRGYNTRTGTRRWTSEFLVRDDVEAVHSEPRAFLVEHVNYEGDPIRVALVRSRTGTLRWRRSTPYVDVSPLGVQPRGRLATLAAVSTRARLVVRSLRTGRKLGEQRLRTAETIDPVSAVGRRRIVDLTFRVRKSATYVDTFRGLHRMWTARVPDRATAPVVPLADGRLFVQTALGSCAIGL